MNDFLQQIESRSFVDGAAPVRPRTSARFEAFDFGGTEEPADAYAAMPSSSLVDPITPVQQVAHHSQSLFQTTEEHHHHEHHLPESPELPTTVPGDSSEPVLPSFESSGLATEDQFRSLESQFQQLLNGDQIQDDVLPPQQPQLQILTEPQNVEGFEQSMDNPDERQQKAFDSAGPTTRVSNSTINHWINNKVDASTRTSITNQEQVQRSTTNTHHHDHIQQDSFFSSIDNSISRFQVDQRSQFNSFVSNLENSQHFETNQTFPQLSVERVAPKGVAENLPSSKVQPVITPRVEVTPAQAEMVRGLGKHKSAAPKLIADRPSQAPPAASKSIHISIGQIEIRREDRSKPVSCQPSSSRRSAKIMSLDDYLKNSGGTS